MFGLHCMHAAMNVRIILHSKYILIDIVSILIVMGAPFFLRAFCIPLILG